MQLKDLKKKIFFFKGFHIGILLTLGKEQITACVKLEMVMLNESSQIKEYRLYDSISRKS